MTASDPIELLTAHVRAMTVDVVTELSDSQLVDRIVAGDYVMSFDEVGARRRNRRRHVVIGAAVALAASGGVAVAALNLRSEPKYPEAGVTCRAAFERDATATVHHEAGDPIDICADEWRNGDLAEEGSGTVPDLVACVSTNGGLEVFPITGAQRCSDLGLAEAVVPSGVDAVVQLQDELAERVNRNCLSREAARQEITKILDALRLSDWQIKELDGDGPCFRAAPLRETSTVQIVPGAVLSN